MSNKNEDLQDSNILKNIDRNMNNSTNKLLYLLVVEDPSVKTKTRIFATGKLDKNAAFVDMFGYEITNVHSTQLKTWNDAVELANKESIELVNMSFPWQRVLSIRNVNYKQKST